MPQLNDATFLAEFNKLQAKRVALDQELIQINSNAANLTDAQKARKVQIQSELDQITAAEKALTAPTLTNSDPNNKITIAAARKDLLAKSVEFITAPPQGSVVVAHPNADTNDLMTYMTLTQHLNPYGRKRQCDSDLEELLVIVDSELETKLKDLRELQKRLASVVKP